MQYSTAPETARHYTASMWNKNERDGKLEELKGVAKQVTGEVTGNQELVEEGKADEVAGKTQAAVGTVTRKVGEAVEKLGEVITKE